METIRSLIRTVEKVDDTKLRHEMLGKVTVVQNKLLSTHEQLRAKQVELEGLRARLGRSGGNAGHIVYDPPM
jgi:hypothetical protein